MSQSNAPRRNERHPVSLDARCRTHTGLRDLGEISDLSSEGCCVTTNELFVNVGTRVLVKPDGMEGLTGIVRWIRGNRAGIEFDSPLYGPVVEHLISRHGKGRAAAVSS